MFDLIISFGARTILFLLSMNQLTAEPPALALDFRLGARPPCSPAGNYIYIYIYIYIIGTTAGPLPKSRIVSTGREIVRLRTTLR